jgi:thiol-disulfide isomerase/thioredoxin
MKNIILGLTVLFFFGSYTPAEKELKWLDWNTGYPLAKKNNKIILVDAYTDWCGWCKKDGSLNGCALEVNADGQHQQSPATPLPVFTLMQTCLKICMMT